GTQFAIDGGFDYVLFMDSDLTNHPRYLKLFYEKMVEGWAYIKASRFLPARGVIGVSLPKRFISFIGNQVARVLYGLPIHDYTNGFRAVRTDLLQQMRLTERGFAVIMEELCEAKRLAATFCEIPYTLTSRGPEDGRSHLSYGFRTWRKYFTHARNASRIPYRAPERMRNT
ncbi:MAG: hypothetical protein Q7S02_01645, partial [bacterium]|nr:hypothetical protein [bacterium]